MAWWITELPGGGMATGEAHTEQQARALIEAHQRGAVEWRERSARYRWAVTDDHGREHTGWADSDTEAWDAIAEVLHRPYRGERRVGPRARWHLAPHKTEPPTPA